MGVFLGLACQFIAINGEKNLRITGVIVSAVSPQTWIDGKILGLLFFAIAGFFLWNIIFAAIAETIAEVLLSFILLLLTTWYLRKAARFFNWGGIEGYLNSDRL